MPESTTECRCKFLKFGCGVPELQGKVSKFFVGLKKSGGGVDGSNIIDIIEYQG